MNSPSGLQVIENCPVTGIQVKMDHMGVRRVKAVETDFGTIESPCVVNCAGYITARFLYLTSLHFPQPGAFILLTQVTAFRKYNHPLWKPFFIYF